MLKVKKMNELQRLKLIEKEKEKEKEKDQLANIKETLIVSNNAKYNAIISDRSKKYQRHKSTEKYLITSRRNMKLCNYKTNVLS